MTRFTRKNGCVFNVSYHIIFVPKYRKSLLVGMFEEIIRNTILDKAEQLNVQVVTYEIMPDHIHLFIKADPFTSISTIVQQLKGYSSYQLRREVPYLRRYKAFWSPSYYCETIGHISESTIKKYIADQKVYSPDSSHH